MIHRRIGMALSARNENEAVEFRSGERPHWQRNSGPESYELITHFCREDSVGETPLIGSGYLHRTGRHHKGVAFTCGNDRAGEELGDVVTGPEDLALETLPAAHEIMTARSAA